MHVDSFVDRRVSTLERINVFHYSHRFSGESYCNFMRSFPRCTHSLSHNVVPIHTTTITLWIIRFVCFIFAENCRILAHIRHSPTLCRVLCCVPGINLPIACNTNQNELRAIRVGFVSLSFALYCALFSFISHKHKHGPMAVNAFVWAAVNICVRVSVWASRVKEPKRRWEKRRETEMNLMDLVLYACIRCRWGAAVFFSVHICHIGPSDTTIHSLNSHSLTHTTQILTAFRWAKANLKRTHRAIVHMVVDCGVVWRSGISGAFQITNFCRKFVYFMVDLYGLHPRNVQHAVRNVEWTNRTVNMFEYVQSHSNVERRRLRSMVFGRKTGRVRAWVSVLYAIGRPFVSVSITRVSRMHFMFLLQKIFVKFFSSFFTCEPTDTMLVSCVCVPWIERSEWS